MAQPLAPAQTRSGDRFLANFLEGSLPLPGIPLRNLVRRA
jgi:hypothetical protein